MPESPKLTLISVVHNHSPMFADLLPSDVERFARDQGLTVKEVCRRAGVSQSIFARWKQGVFEPSLRNYRRFRDVVAPLPNASASSDATAEPAKMTKVA